jgi:hypothetical protein
LTTVNDMQDMDYQKMGEETMMKLCSKCGTKLTNFIAYIPGEGEACMKCYVDYMREDESNTLQSRSIKKK